MVLRGKLVVRIDNGVVVAVSQNGYPIHVSNTTRDHVSGCVLARV